MAYGTTSQQAEVPEVTLNMGCMRGHMRTSNSATVCSGSLRTVSLGQNPKESGWLVTCLRNDVVSGTTGICGTGI